MKYFHEKELDVFYNIFPIILLLTLDLGQVLEKKSVVEEEKDGKQKSKLILN